ncbi:MAG: SDR family oxidoreductase [Actinomycetes bacterium]
MSIERVAIVTGGSKGIGRACVERFLEDGYAVSFCARNADEVTRAVGELSAKGNILGVQADVGVPADCSRLVSDTIARFGRVDALVNNAGVYAPVPFVEFTPETWDALMAINVRGPVLLGGAVARLMRDQGSGGRIVNIASTNGQMSEAQFAHYNASKAAVISLTKTMAVELAEYGILVNAVAPGWVLTPLSEDYVATLNPEALGRISPLKRVGRANEVAGAVAYLCGEDSTYVTGITINVDGGLIGMHPAI